MADFLEDLGSDDVNRKIDRGDFQASLFEVFTHDYREKTDPACCGEDSTDHEACKQSDQNSNRAKKELVNITRKLQKALISLRLMKGSDAISGMLEEIEDVNAQLRDIIIKTGSEFTQTSVPFPEYDEIDMKCLLGDEEVNEQKSMLELVKEEITTNKTQLDAVMFRAECLLHEYDHLRNGIKEGCKTP